MPHKSGKRARSSISRRQHSAEPRTRCGAPVRRSAKQWGSGSMDRPAKIQEAVDRFRKIGPPAIKAIFSRMTDEEKAACDRWIIEKYPKIVDLYRTIDERFDIG